MKVKINCPSCHHATELDSDKIPNQQVTFACPKCQAKVKVDGAKLHAEAAKAPDPAPAPAPQPATERPPSGDDLLDHLDLPEDAKLPSGLVIGDVTVEEELRKCLGPHGSNLRGCGSAEEARALLTLTLPEVMFFCGGQISAPPFEPIQPIVDLPPDERRKTFIVLIGDNVKTLDGNAAFFHGVDLIINRSDLGRSHKVLFSALQYRARLCAPFTEAIAAIEG